MAEKTEDKKRKDREATDFLGVTVTGLLIAMILMGNALLYYFVVVPFGQIYRLSMTIQYLIVGASTAVTLGIFFYIKWVEDHTGGSEQDLILERDIPTMKTSNPVREAEILLSELDYNIRTKNYGKVIALHGQLQSALQSVPAKKREAARPRIESLEEQIEELKAKGLV